MADSIPSSSAPASPAAVTLWPADVLARQMVSDDPLVRTVALGMALQPGAPIDRCVDSLVSCAGLCDGDALASQLAATALGSVPPASATPAVQASLAAFLPTEQQMPVRIAAAH